MTDYDHGKSMNLIDQVKDSWLSNGIKIRPGAALKQIEAFEVKYSVRLPLDLRAYFMAVDGMEPGEMDPGMFAFLPLSAVKSIPQELALFGGTPDYREIKQTLIDPHRWFVIVDYLTRLRRNQKDVHVYKLLECNLFLAANEPFLYSSEQHARTARKSYDLRL